MRKTIIVITFVAAIITVVSSLYFLNTQSGTVATSTATSTGASTSTTRVQLAMLDTTGEGTGKQRGCDRVVMVPLDIPATSAPLTAAMQQLFALSTSSYGGAFNFIDRTNETLSFESATVAGGVAKIYLAGSLSGLAGVCDDPRAQIQIEETALQFSTVHHVEIYLNGTLTNLTPSQQ